MALEEKNMSTNVYVGMRYWYPFTEEAIQQVRSMFYLFPLPCNSNGGKNFILLPTTGFPNMPVTSRFCLKHCLK